MTLFPGSMSSVLGESIIGRAAKKGAVEINCVQIRDYTENKQMQVDDYPYGGGWGLVMMAQPLDAAIVAAKGRLDSAGIGNAPVIYLSPQGKPLDHEKVMALSSVHGMILLCGRYEAVDQRLIDKHVDEEISLGDFVLSGGEIPAMAFMDAIIRQLPGVLHDDLSAVEDSFVSGILDCPHFTRPPQYEGVPVPDVLMNGNHAEIARWRRRQALLMTLRKRPDLLRKADEAGKLSAEDKEFLSSGSWCIVAS